MDNRFSKAEKIRFQHCDFAGIVFYPRYFVMLNDLVEDWFEEALGYSFNDMHPNYGVPTVNVNTNFHKPARLGEHITKSLYIEKLGKKSVVYRFAFTNAQGDQIVEGEGTLVFIEKDEKGGLKSKAWTEELLNKMRPFVSNP
ncbi:acyl-CoA thioesterase [Sediminicola luteus]|uniref:Thioesterase domain-containing protein n=1 Tax=Sediminicola luteus TaxID=319238 RepID=A0A2A4GD58_9FLAO|nr:acyl-CoA thioesterase [Sediminicola luteus]PCE65906.1 hypothetical protein B7P33_00980 [Sediminicola luteus]